LISQLNEMGEKYGYTTKTYNLLGLALMLKSDYERALKIFESALGELKLDTPEGEAKHLYNGNQDLASLLINYLKCNCIVKGGCGTNPIEFFKTDAVNVAVLTYLGKVNQMAIQEFFEERKRAEAMFDEAVR
jgi:tetratricopeptide (TPR) repeat protein